MPALRDARKTRSVLVLDGEQRAALAVVRSLGRAGYQVLTGAETPRALAAASRYSRETLLLPSPLQAPAAFRAAVADQVAAQAPDAVVPVTEASALTLLGDPRLTPLLPLPPRAAFLAAHDKVALMQRAAGLGIDVPRFVTLHDAGDGAAEIWDTFPAIVKPGRSVVGPERLRETEPAYVVIMPWNLKDEIASQHSYIQEWGGRFVIFLPEVRVLEGGEWRPA